MEKDLDIVSVDRWGVFPSGKPYIIAGPCSAETEGQVLSTAEGLLKSGVHVFRAGIWKPRTHPGCFEGIGEAGLDWLNEVQKRMGMAVCTEVAGKKHVELCLKHNIDMLWIGARTTANPFLMQEIADALSGSDVPVLVKNPVNPDLELWIGALERLNLAGVRKLGVIHRGFSSYEKILYRNNPQWNLAIELRSRYPQLPVICDPSHMGGDTRFIRELSQKALDFGFDGLMIESHCNPSCALSDSSQQITPEQLCELLSSRLIVRNSDSDDLSYKQAMERLRARIDIIDEQLLSVLSSRMEISRLIGQFKKENNIAIIQAVRWENLIEEITGKADQYGLDGEFLSKLFNLIHQESIDIQNRILHND